MASGWQRHSAPFLKRALLQASRTWKPKAKRPNLARIKKLQAQRAKVNAEIKRERSK